MKIVTDCAADLPTEEARDLNISVAPLFIQFPEGEVNSNEISADEFYQRLEAMQPNIPTTAQPSERIFSDLYQKIASKGEEVISIHISSGLSGTVNSARLAARQMTDRLVHIVDSMTLSGAERFQVLSAARAIQHGWNIQQIMHRLEEVRNKTEIIYTLDTLKYLARGGRIGRVQALAGSLLNIKPIIRVEHGDGKYSTVGKARTIRRAMEDIADHIAAMYHNEKALWVSVMHGNFTEQAELMTRVLREKLNIGKLEILRISPVLGVHTGPGVVGAAVVPQHLLDEYS
jgi:DegV family protein with EDD domain